MVTQHHHTARTQVTQRTSRTARDATALLLACLLMAFAVQSAGHDHDPGAPVHHHAGEVAEGLVGTIDAATPAVFWETPHIACDTPPPAAQPSAPNGCDEVDALVWTVEVATAADQLRVDFDQPLRQDGFRLLVSGPGTAPVSQPSGNTYSHGVRIEDPTPGTWTVQLEPQRTNGTTVRLRAGLVDTTPPPAGALLPNLRVLPPFEFGFAAPINPLNPQFLAGDDQNPPMTVAGQNLRSCATDEVQEASDPTRQDEPVLLLRCLRFTTGPQNVGPGHFTVEFPIADRAQHDQDRIFEMTQVLYDHLGRRVDERPAGTYEYHATHAHYHYTDILYYEAFAVTDAASGTMEPVGVGHKSGFCPVDQGYGAWSRFDQLERGTAARLQRGDCFAIDGRGAMSLTAGWGDVYRWQRSGQYVDFSGVGDGTFVIRATVDVLDNVLETDETDNSSYALIEVTGDEVEVLERGYGDSPWDPDKVIATDHRDR